MPPMFAPVFISVSVVLHHSALDVLADTLHSLVASVVEARAAGRVGDAELLIVDNSADMVYRQEARRLVDRIAGESLFVRHIHAASNKGFGAGHNLALAAARGELQLILNPDVTLESAALKEGIETLQLSTETVLVAPRVLGASGAPEHLCKRYPSVGLLFARALAWRPLIRALDKRLARYEMRELARIDETREVELVSGCFMLTRTAALRAVSGFDEAYFLYFEDYDLSLRLAEQGRLVYQPRVRVLHHGGYAARKGWRHIALFGRSGYRFFSRYGWRWL